MTGFATSEVAIGAQKLIWEIRSVNHRFFDVAFRLPEEVRRLEVDLRALIGDRIKRGKVDCTLKLVSAEAGRPLAAVDAVEVNRLRELERAVREISPEARELSVSDILRWPGVLGEQKADVDLSGPVLESFALAVDSLLNARDREGARLAEILTEKLDAISGLMSGIDADLAAAAPRYRDRLLERLERLDIDANPERLEQELAIIVQRTDAVEEADRLKGHLTEIRRVLGQDGPIGRRLDFLIQELNREANTMASKVQDDELGRCAVDLKVLIEQMREQVQNIE